MSGFTAEDVRRLAALARLELTPGEIDAFARQLGDILAFATEVQAVDVTAVALANIGPDALLPPAPAWREDTLADSLERDAALGATPAADREAGVFKVPRVLNG